MGFSRKINQPHYVGPGVVSVRGKVENSQWLRLGKIRPWESSVGIVSVVSGRVSRGGFG